MEMKETILALCKKRNTNYSEIARKIGTTKQNICNKFARNKFYLDDIEKIAEALDCTLEIKFIDNQTGENLL
ncbi:MAG: helix-turn-helix transcriptional regulator [Treponema sp.]|nr:helix-turn-helix transcriptional regulator [Treponema sp.]